MDVEKLQATTVLQQIILCKKCQEFMFKNKPVENIGSGIKVTFVLCTKCNYVNSTNYALNSTVKESHHLNEKILWKLIAPTYGYNLNLCNDCNLKTSIEEDHDKINIIFSLCYNCAFINISKYDLKKFKIHQ